MRILIYCQNFYPDLTGIGKYSGEMAEWLSRHGHDIRVITAPPYYPEWKISKQYSSIFYRRELINGVRVWRCPLWVPITPTNFTRIMHLLSFAFTSFPVILSQIFWKPQVIFVIEPPLFCAPTASLISKVCNASSWLHIQDFEVDAFFGVSDINSRVKQFVHSIEHWLLQGFDRISTISQGMLNRAVEKGVAHDKLVFFPNWSELKRFENATKSSSFLESLGVPNGEKVVLYSGNLGDKQGVEDIVEAAHLLSNVDHIFFLIVGEGARKTRIVDRAQSLQLNNIAFAALQPYETLPQLLASADCHLVVQKRGVADTVLPSKLTNILAVGGNSVITAEKKTTLGQLCEDHPGIAIRVEPESPEALAESILQSLNMASPNQVAKKYANKYLDKDEILSEFEKELIKLVENI